MDSVKNYNLDDILKILGEKPQNDGLHIYFQRKEIKDIPFDYPYRYENYTIHFVLKGKVSLQLNLVDHYLEENDMIVIPPNTLIAFNWVEQQSQLATVSFSLGFALKNSYKNEVLAFDFSSSRLIKKIALTKEQWDSILSIALFLEKKNSRNAESFLKDEIISHAFNIFLYELAIAREKSEGSVKNILTRKEDLVLRFLKLLEIHFKYERTPSFYSDKLAVSNSYLSKVLKLVTGKTIGKLIEDSLINEAKILLVETTLSISQISDELQFSDQSFFGKFFKRHNGLSPSVYRINRHSISGKL